MICLWRGSFWCLLILVLAQGEKLTAQEEWQELSSVPQRMEIVKDQEGFSWQLTGAGSFYDMGSNSFKSAHQMKVNGTSFRAEKAASLSETRFSLQGNINDIRITRDVWMDLERSGARHYDAFENISGAPIKVKVELETDFSYSWENLHSSTGKILGMELGPRDAGVFVKFDPRDGQSDVFYLINGERADLTPSLTTNNNNREIIYTFEFELAAKERVAICHWIGQRAISNVENIKRTFAPFYQRRHLVRPRIPTTMEATKLANFEVHDPGAPAPKPHDASILIALNELMDSLQMQRFADDLLWVSDTNQLSGEVLAGGEFDFKSSLGTITLSLDELAALRGGGGNGRMHEAYTRDGERFAGEVLLADARMKGADGWEMDLEPYSLETILFRVEEEDGRLADGIWGFAELDTGDVIALNGGQESPIPFSTPWGTLQVELGEIIELSPMALPTPRYRLELSDGCRLTGFLMPAGDLNLGSPRLGAFSMGESGASLRSLWQLDGYKATVDWEDDFETEWAELDDTGKTYTWLEGGNRLVAKLDGSKLHLIAGKTVTPIPPSDIALLRRTEEGILDRVPLFEVELKNGDLLTGQLRERAIMLNVRGKRWEIPTLHLLGFHQGTKP